MAGMRVATWNLERKRPTSPTGRAGVDLLRGLDADVLVLTEARTSFPLDGHVVACEPLPYEHVQADERRVLLWSQQPWEDVDVGRFVTARTQTPVGPVRVVGVCISWHMANVNVGDRNRKPWEDHLRYLEHLPNVLRRWPEPMIVAGDFNQRIPRLRGRLDVAEALQSCFEGFDVVTSGAVDGTERPLIDHIALAPGLRARRVWAWPSVVDGIRMSDHDGVAADVAGG